jgi:lysophospholipase L1-like esterase
MRLPQPRFPGSVDGGRTQVGVPGGSSVHRMKRAIFAVVLLLALALPVALAELAMRWIGLGDPVVYYTNASYRYAPAPDQRQERRDSAVVTIDADGLRGLEPWGAEADQHILFLGDSVTWGGTNTDDAATFAARTCTRLEEQRGGNLICGNGGVNGYGVDNVTARLRFDPAVSRADSIVVTVITVDATRGLSDLKSSYFYSARPHGPLKALWELSGFALFYGSGKLRLDRSAHEARDDMPVLNESLLRLYQALRNAQQQGKQVLIVFSPIAAELEGAEGPLTHAVRASIQNSGLPSLDLTEPMAARRNEDLYYDGVHLNSAGHELYAGWIAEALDRPTLASQQF